MRNQRQDSRRNSSSNRRREIHEEEKKNTALIIIIILVVLAGLAITALNLKIFEGKLEKTDIKYLEAISLKIKDETMKDFKYELTYIKDGEEISVDGEASKKFIVTATTKIDKEDVVFKRTTKGIEIKYKEEQEETEIELDGTYIKKPVYIDIEKYTDIFKNEDMEKDVEDLLKEDFYDFKETVFGVLFEDYDYELDGDVYEVTLASKKRASLIIIVDEKMYIGYYNNGIAKYFTNDSEYKTIMPSKIKVWMEQKDTNN